MATQDGTVEILNVGKRRDWDIGLHTAHRTDLMIYSRIEPQRTTIQVHSNAILDTKWRMDDQCLVRILPNLRQYRLTLSYLLLRRPLQATQLRESHV